MTLAGLTWADTGASDIHLLPGLVSPELTRLLRAKDLDPATGIVTLKQLHNVPGITVEFAAQFVGAFVGNGTSGKFVGHGISMAAKIGEVTVTAPTKLRSFLVTATAKQGGLEVTARIRVNVHSAIDRAWLTPSPLTVRKGAKNMRLSLLAKFDDGLIGDITNWAPFVPPGAPTDFTFVHAQDSPLRPVLSWSAEGMTPDVPAVTVDPVTGVLNATSDSGIAKITAHIGDRSASAAVVCAPPWGTPVNLTYVSGPGVLKQNFVPNILFLPDGFQEADKLSYKRIVKCAVKLLLTRPKTRPFPILAGRMNFFMAWLASPDAGVSVLNELDRQQTQTGLEGEPIMMPSVQPPINWTLVDLINEVGLPTPVEDPDGSQLNSARIKGWQEIYGPHITEGRMKHLFARWLRLNDRVLLNECDTAFHMAFGDRPALDGTTLDRGLAVNPRRLHNDDFEAFLDALRGPIDRDHPTGIEMNNLWTTGKDRNLVLVLCRSNRRGGLNASRSPSSRTEAAKVSYGKLLGVSLGSDNHHRLAEAEQGRDGWSLRPDPVRKEEIHWFTWLTIAHELAHSWTLGDEYGGIASAPTPAHVAESANYSNVQDRASLLNADGELTSDKIKWGKWPRIAKAGVLRSKPEPIADNKLLLKLLPGVGPALPNKAKFAKGDIVRLRTWPLPASTGHSRPFVVEHIFGIDGNDLMVAPLSGTVIDPGFKDRYPPSSIVMVPVRAKDPNPEQGKYGAPLGLMSVEARDIIDTTHNPLNATLLEQHNRPCANVELRLPTSADSLAGAIFVGGSPPKLPRFSAFNIGLYENGGEFNCGFYRPTGICLMCTDQFNFGEKIEFYEFCLVCRYAIVDNVDPRLHFEVEEDFKQRYGPSSETLPDK